MPPDSPWGQHFTSPLRGRKKYVALVPLNGTVRRVSFGDRAYEHYRDVVPALDGWSEVGHKDHLDARTTEKLSDPSRCSRVRERCTRKEVRYSPAWFSYHFLW